MPSFDFENKIEGIVAGVDEVGCGPWAGPLLAVACVINQDKIPLFLLENIDDSKSLSKKKREEIFLNLEQEINHSLYFGVGCIEIEDFNILGLKNALPLAMNKAVTNLPFQELTLIIDGVRNPKLNYTTHMVKKGDSYSFSIAAASIYAKVLRDRIMEELHIQYPQYGWNNNAGYGTKEHREAINLFGITTQHRLCYAPIRKFLENRSCL